jgi:hypothetical protein
MTAPGMRAGSHDRRRRRLGRPRRRRRSHARWPRGRRVRGVPHNPAAGRAGSTSTCRTAPATLDNGQHILIGAYTATLALMREVGVDPAQRCCACRSRCASRWRRARPAGLAAPLDAAGIVTARGWTWRDKLSLLRTCHGSWRLQASPARATDRRRPVQGPAAGGAARADRAAVRLGAEHAGRPRAARFSCACCAMRCSRRTAAGRVQSAVAARRPGRAVPAGGGGVAAGARCRREHRRARAGRSRRLDTGWQVDGERFDRSCWRLRPGRPRGWSRGRHRRPGLAGRRGAGFDEAITTVYTMGGRAFPCRPCWRCAAGPGHAPAQFAFDRGYLGGPPGLLAWW